jgi:uncharacterized membrane protein
VSAAAAATVAAAVGCGLVAGVFLAFSAFVMAALAGLPPAQGIAAMQAVNRTAVRAAFTIALLGTGLLCLGLVGWAALAAWPEAPWVVAGGALYLLGPIGVTVVGNVPRNDALAGLDPHAAGAAAHWQGYVRAWSALNHVRCAAGAGAAVLLTVATAT